METPVLNFSDLTARPLTHAHITKPINVDSNGAGTFSGGTLPASKEAVLNGYGGTMANALGMWHQFGTIPSGEEGIFLSLQDIDPSFLARSGSVTDIDTSFYTNSDNMKSLADALGFTKSEQKIGRLKRSNTVYEAVIAIPYFIDPEGDRAFFGISRDKIDDALRNLEYDDPAASYASTLEEPAGESIIEMVRRMQKFVLPPRFDFVRNESVDPFAMYIFEFSHTFDQDDLSDLAVCVNPVTNRHRTAGVKGHARQQITKHALHRETDHAGCNRRRCEQHADIKSELVLDQHEGNAQHDGQTQQASTESG